MSSNLCDFTIHQIDHSFSTSFIAVSCRFAPFHAVSHHLTASRCIIPFHAFQTICFSCWHSINFSMRRRHFSYFATLEAIPHLAVLNHTTPRCLGPRPQSRRGNRPQKLPKCPRCHAPASPVPPVPPQVGTSSIRVLCTIPFSRPQKQP